MIDFKFNEKPFYKFALHFTVDHNMVNNALEKIKSSNSTDTNTKKIKNTIIF